GLERAHLGVLAPPKEPCRRVACDAQMPLEDLRLHVVSENDRRARQSFRGEHGGVREIEHRDGRPTLEQPRDERDAFRLPVRAYRDREPAERMTQTRVVERPSASLLRPPMELVAHFLEAPTVALGKLLRGGRYEHRAEGASFQPSQNLRGPDLAAGVDREKKTGGDEQKLPPCHHQQAPTIAVVPSDSRGSPTRSTTRRRRSPCRARSAGNRSCFCPTTSTSQCSSTASMSATSSDSMCGIVSSMKRLLAPMRRERFTAGSKMRRS